MLRSYKRHGITAANGGAEVENRRELSRFLELIDHVGTFFDVVEGRSLLILFRGYFFFNGGKLVLQLLERSFPHLTQLFLPPNLLLKELLLSLQIIRHLLIPI